MYKQVENITQGGKPSAANKASPGDILRYTLFFRNMGAGPIKSLFLKDSTPPFSYLHQPVVCPGSDALPEGLSGCELNTSGGMGNHAGYHGELIWTLIGELRPGASGQVSFEVVVE